MTPIVFCASFVPWASETREAEPIWPQRNPASWKRWATPAVEPRADGRHHHRDDGGEERGHDHLAHDPVEFAAVADPVDTGEAQPGDRRADEPAEEGVGGRRRQAEQPGQEVPDDAAAEAGQDDEQQRIAAIGEQGRARRPALVLDLDDCVGHGERDLDGEESADEVEHGAEEDGGFRAEGARGDRGRHGVSGVVETVGEVEGQGCRDDEAEDDGCGGHAYIVRMPLPELSGLGSPMSKSSATVHAPYAGRTTQRPEPCRPGALRLVREVCRAAHDSGSRTAYLVLWCGGAG